ncbi:MAG TPA: ABC transporter permease [Terriglobia bacterium]|nr:ABC transporter permease [Terriglobia bacterium]
MSKKGALTLPKAILYLIVCLVLFFLIVPNLIVVPISFNESSLLLFPPKGFSLQWYSRYWEMPGWVDATVTSLVVATMTAIVSLVIGGLAAYGLVRGRPTGGKALNSLLMLPMIIPSLVTAIALFNVLSYLRLTGTLAGFVIGHTVVALPFVVTIMSASLRSIDLSVENAARNLGASRLMTIWRVTLPMAIPGLISSGLFAFLISFDELLIALFISSPTVATLPKKLWDGIRFEIEPTLAAVSTLLVMLSLFILAMAGVVQLVWRKCGNRRRTQNPRTAA